ncbi:MAG: right-handed parallel beta-helix repeat-containing protein [Mariniphaga sp.]|nr:right-handed parallel beta-helix repeat-containing protein [Mariniphaga sp.]
MKNLILLILFITGSHLLRAQPNTELPLALVSPRLTEKEITVGGDNADIHGFTNESIQYAIDAVAKTGGTVRLTTGIFKIAAPIQLKSNVKIIGAGKETVLKRGKGVQTKYIVDADYGELKLTVENTNGFEPGMKIQVTDRDNSSCWNVSTAYITDILDNTIYIDDYLIRDYRSDREGMVSNASSVIEVINAENVWITNLTADGNRSENYFADGCNSAGILIIKSKKVTVDHVHVKDFNGEGISWQITENVTIKNSEISGCGNTGMHPGSGSPFTVIEHNDVHHNDFDGLFICWRVSKSEVRNNKFHHNGRFGICTGHKDTDVIFTENHIYNNGGDGVHLRIERESNAPHRNTFVKNIIENNGTKNGGYGFSINSPAQDLVLKENIFKSTGKKTQKAAIYIQSAGIEPTLIQNLMDGHPEGELIREK